jgi:hypothetical protein
MTYIPTIKKNKGKTMTLVEAVLQILKRNVPILPDSKKKQRNARILLCAPSEAAANVLCSQLSPHLDEKQVHVCVCDPLLSTYIKNGLGLNYKWSLLLSLLAK